jgi:hypothetical protein
MHALFRGVAVIPVLTIERDRSHARCSTAGWHRDLIHHLCGFYCATPSRNAPGTWMLIGCCTDGRLGASDGRSGKPPVRDGFCTRPTGCRMLESLAA